MAGEILTDDFKIGDDLYECAYCGSKFQYQTLYNKEKLDKIAQLNIPE